MLAILELTRPLFLEAQIRFVHKRGALQSVAGTFPLQVMMCHLPEFVVNQRERGAKGLVVTGMPVSQQLTDGLERKLRQTKPPNGAPESWVVKVA